MICVGVLVMVQITVQTGHSSYRDYVNQLVLVSEGSDVMVITRKKVTAASGVIEKLVKFVDFEIILRLFLRAARVFEWPMLWRMSSRSVFCLV